MGLFRNTKALEHLEERLESIADIVADFGRKQRSLELEYIELYDKVKRQMSRMAKRSAVDMREMNDEPVDLEPDDGVDPISREILARRGGPRAER